MRSFAFSLCLILLLTSFNAHSDIKPELQMTADSPTRLGDLDAPVMLELFFSLGCPHCLDFLDKNLTFLKREAEEENLLLLFYEVPSVQPGPHMDYARRQANTASFYLDCIAENNVDAYLRAVEAGIQVAKETVVSTGNWEKGGIAWQNWVHASKSDMRQDKEVAADFFNSELLRVAGIDRDMCSVDGFKKRLSHRYDRLKSLGAKTMPAYRLQGEMTAHVDQEMILDLINEFKASPVDPQTTVSPPPASVSPALKVETRDECMLTLKKTNVRARPDSQATKLGTLFAGTEVKVTGEVEGVNWYRVALRDGKSGYVVVGDLLSEQSSQVTAVQPAPSPSHPTEVVSKPAVDINYNIGDTFRDCPNCPLMVVVPPGSFTMGSPSSEAGRVAHEGPQHRVTIPKKFAVGVYEVTWDEYEACVRAEGCGMFLDGPNGTSFFDEGGYDRGFGRGKRPVMLSWQYAKKYAEWLSLETGQTYKLLSEAEWEYVARAGTTTPFSFGSEITPDQANYKSERGDVRVSTGSYRAKTMPVGSFRPNAFGLYDVHGNVWELTEDRWNDDYAGAPTNGEAWMTGDCGVHVKRGGGWASPPSWLRSAARYGRTGRGDFVDTGFRISRTLVE